MEALGLDVIKNMYFNIKKIATKKRIIASNVSNQDIFLGPRYPLKQLGACFYNQIVKVTSANIPSELHPALLQIKHTLWKGQIHVIRRETCTHEISLFIIYLSVFVLLGILRMLVPPLNFYGFWFHPLH